MIFFGQTSVLARWALFGVSGAGLGLFAPQIFAAPLQGYIMVVQMTPAVCMFDPQKAKQRKCLEGYSLNISGLYPETSQTECRTASSANLSPLQAKVVARVMPDENARTQLWHGIGGCVQMNSSQYFRTIINYAERLKIPTELTSPETRVMYQANLRQQFLRLNPSLPANAIQFNCVTSQGNAVLTEVKLCYKNNGQYKRCSVQVENTCPNAFTIKGSY
ncbi:ribonuclease T2 family protein [Acinetobacter sp.]|uniref:ribonuclease T2 family protein n=1 Tax=Acinetobacter sp. TaxID=472 RepID=UPI0028AA08A5|nr:ribonuclease I [Acinetobacter sp.]